MLIVGVMEDQFVRCVMEVDGDQMRMMPSDGLDVPELVRVLRLLADALDDGPKEVH